MSDNNIHNNNEENKQDLENSLKKKSKLTLTYPQPAFAYKGPKFAENKPTVKSEDIQEEEIQIGEVQMTKDEQVKETQIEIPFESQSKVESESVEEVVISEQNTSKIDQKSLFDNISSERVIPVASSIKEQPVRPSLFAKYKRLLLVLLALLLLLLAFWVLKPNTPKVVEELKDSQSNDLPIEFRPIDEEEVKRAEEAKKALIAQKEAEALQQKEKDQKEEITLNTGEQPLAQTSETQPAEKTSDTPSVLNVASTTNTPSNTAEVINKPQIVEKEVTDQDLVKDKKTVEKSPIKDVKETKVAERVKQKAVHHSKPKVTKTNTKTKVLVMKDGVSLMQLFRDNHLKLSDLNAMIRAKDVFRNLNQGDRVTLQLDNNRRVKSMSIKGGRFIRQSNGKYIYKK